MASYLVCGVPHAFPKRVRLIHDFASAEVTSYCLNKFDVFCSILTVPLDILLSQKYFCVLTRPLPMGRDFYDTSFLLGKTKANLDYLEAKIGAGSLSEVRERLIARCKELDLRKLAADVEPFVIKPSDIDRVLLFPELVLNSLK